MSNIYEGKKVFIPGGSGLVGHALSRQLLEAGAEVIVASLDDPERAPKGTKFIRADLMDYNNCVKLLIGGGGKLCIQSHRSERFANYMQRTSGIIL